MYPVNQNVHSECVFDGPMIFDASGAIKIPPEGRTPQAIDSPRHSPLSDDLRGVEVGVRGETRNPINFARSATLS